MLRHFVIFGDYFCIRCALTLFLIRYFVCKFIQLNLIVRCLILQGLNELASLKSISCKILRLLLFSQIWLAFWVSFNSFHFLELVTFHFVAVNFHAEFLAVFVNLISIRFQFLNSQNQDYFILCDKPWVLCFIRVMPVPAILNKHFFSKLFWFCRNSFSVAMSPQHVKLFLQLYSHLYLS